MPSTSWRVLDHNERIQLPKAIAHQPFVPPVPMRVGEVDFHDVTNVAPVRAGKRQYQVEGFNVVDCGSSMFLD